MKSKFILFLVTIFILLIGSVYAIDVLLETKFEVGKKWTVLLTKLKPMANSQSSVELDKLHGIVKNDLEFSGYFTVITTDRVPKSSGAIAEVDFGFLRDLNVEAYTEGSYSASGDRVYLELDLMNPKNALRLWGKRYRGNMDSLREMAHRFSDELVFNMTGNQGIANSKIAFISKATGNKELYTMDYDGFNVTQLTKDGTITLSPSWSPDNNEIAYVSYKRAYPSIFTMDVKTRKTQLVASYPGLNSAPSWSPDGKNIVASLNKDGDDEIYLLDPKGQREPKRLTFSKGIDTSPRWSPTSKQLVFVSNRSGSPQLYTMDVDGSNVRRLTHQGSYNASPSWSPKGDLISYVSQHREGFNVYITTMDGQNRVQLTGSAGSNEDPTWSPDGRHIVFNSTRTGSAEIFILSLSGNKITQITRSRHNSSQPSWSR